MHRSTHALRYSLPAICLTAGCLAGRVDDPRPLVVVASGDTAGWIVPCGCTSNQSGGLLRRGSYLETLRGGNDVLYVDVGGAASGTSEYDRLKFEAILRGEAQMGAAAHNIGISEAAFGAARLREIRARSGVPLLTCNVRDGQGELLGERLRIVKAAGRRIALVGVLSGGEGMAGLQIDPPREAILAALAQPQQDYDSLVVLAYLPENELMELAANLPEADLVIGGPTGQSVAPRRLGPTLVASATNKGKFLARFTAPPIGSLDWQGEIVEMNDRFEDASRQRANLDQWYQTLAERELTPAQTSFARILPADIPPDFRIAGTKSCGDCHADDCQLWDDSRHAHAWRSLTNTGAHVDAYCQQCHTTGFGLPGGFVSARRSAAHTAVGCESCHGPSRRHVHDPQTRTNYAGQARHQCTGCHDRENSPSFDVDNYWERIRHGENP